MMNRLDILYFVDYISASMENLEYRIDPTYKVLERINCVIENEEPISGKQWRHWKRLSDLAERACIALEDMIEYYEKVKQYITND